MSGQEIYDDNIIELIGEDGESVNFEHLDTLELNGNTYVVLTELVEEDSDEESSDAYVMKIVDDEGEEVLEAVEDDAELDAVFEAFKERVGDDFDFEEE